MYCEFCGNKLKDNAKFCDSCGVAVNPIPLNIEPISQDEIIISTSPADNQNYEYSNGIISLLRWSIRLDYLVGACAIISSLLYVFITVCMILLGVVTFWLFFLSIVAFFAACLSGAIVFALWAMAMTHIRSGKRIKEIINNKTKFEETDRKTMKKAMIIELISVAFGWLCSYGVLKMEYADFLKGDGLDRASMGSAIFLLVFFVAIIANQIIKFIAYRKLKSE